MPVRNITLGTYSDAHKKVYGKCFIKQKCQLQMGIVKYKNVAMPLSTLGINTTHQHYQIYITISTFTSVCPYGVRPSASAASRPTFEFPIPAGV